MLGKSLRNWLLAPFRGRKSVHLAGCKPASEPLFLEPLSQRALPAVTASLAGGTLSILGTPGNDFIQVQLSQNNTQIAVVSSAVTIAQFPFASVTLINVQGLAGDDRLQIDKNLPTPATLDGGDGRDILIGGAGPTTLKGQAGIDKLTAGSGVTSFDAGSQADYLFGVKLVDTVIAPAAAKVVPALPIITAPVIIQPVLNQTDVDYLLQRASAASASEDAIIAIVDRNGVLLGLRIEAGVDSAIRNNIDLLVYAVDGAIAKARTAAFFASNQAPLTSRTVQFISQTTMTQREIEAYPSIADPDSIMKGPGFVAPVGIAGHFPPNIKYTPQVDLFGIEHTNRDSIYLGPGPDGIPYTADDDTLLSRFNVDPSFIEAGKELPSPESYGYTSGYEPDAQSRGIATLPGGIPIYKPSESDPTQRFLVGGIGVFFPGKTGFATEENSALSSMYNAALPDRSFEAEYIAFAAVGGQVGEFTVGQLGSVPLNPTYQLPSVPPNRIDLVGITLDLFGPGGTEGPTTLINYGKTLGVGDAFSGQNYRVSNNGLPPINAAIYNPAYFAIGTPVPDGWLVVPHDGVGITAAQVNQMIQQGIAQADQTRSAIRLPLNQSAKMVFAVSDQEGNIVGLYRMPDATVFSIDVAVAKARNLAYYNNAAKLQPIDQLPGLAPGTAITNRTVRYAALPRFPEGIDSSPPGPFSILNDGNVNPFTGVQVGPRLPASAFQSVQGYDAFNPGTNFHDPYNKKNQNGVIFFPGSSGVYAGTTLIGGFGVSGDGVDQDDVIASLGIVDYAPNPAIRVDQFRVRGIRLPYMKFNRNPEGGVIG